MLGLMSGDGGGCWGWQVLVEKTEREEVKDGEEGFKIIR